MNNKNVVSKNFIYLALSVLVTFGLSVALQSILATWQPPANPAPNNGGISLNQWGKTGSDLYFTGGNVGIGTNAPTSQLHILNSQNTPTNITVQNSYPNSDGLFGDPGIRMKSRSADFKIFANDESNALYFWDITGGASRMIIDGSGNVSVANNMNIGHNGIAISGDDTINPYINLSVGDTSTGNALGHGIILRRARTGAGADHWANIGLLNDTTLGIGVEGNGVGWSSDLLTINSSGNVGIGMINPNNRLDVNGNIAMTNGNRLYLTDGDDKHYIYSTGIGGNNMYFGEWNGNFHFIDTHTNAEEFSISSGGINVPGSICVGGVCRKNFQVLGGSSNLFYFTAVNNHNYDAGPWEHYSAYYTSGSYPVSNLDYTRPILGVRIFGSSDDGGACVVWFPGYFIGGVTNRAHFTSMSVDSGNFGVDAHPNGANSMLDKTFWFKDLKTGFADSLVQDEYGSWNYYEDNFAYDNSYYVPAYIPGSASMQVKQYYRDGGLGPHYNNCSVQVIYGQYN